MAFSFTVDSSVHVGGTRIVYGGYNCNSVTGGDIKTGLSVVNAIHLQPKGTSILANQPVVNETLPLANTDGAVTIVTTSGEVGTWFAVGS